MQNVKIKFIQFLGEKFVFKLKHLMIIMKLVYPLYSSFKIVSNFSFQMFANAG